ncbi:MAG TPA: polyketide cyclase [Parvularcula sp.]|nr:polyketide cyclase [Parvularcula sp.]HBS34704.1 polyketide cyclase [Parvularcula sp.]
MTSQGTDLARAAAFDLFQTQTATQFDHMAARLDAGMIEGASWRLSCPIDEIKGAEALAAAFWRPLRHSFPDFERQDDIVLAGEFRDSAWVASTGHFIGTFERDWLGIPANRQATYIRYGEILKIENDRIAGGHMILDIVGVARQAGVDLVPRGLGAELLTPAPVTHDGVRHSSGPDTESRKSLLLVEAMIGGLMQYDRKTLSSMEQERFWHPDMMWYGPSGIGVTRGLKGFQTYHQKPFLDFIPDRVGGNHVARIGDGNYVASGGWPSINATSSGAPWISTPIPAGKRITMRVMDFWRREGDLLRENWVFIDIPDVFRQFSIDVFAPLRREER